MGARGVDHARRRQPGRTCPGAEVWLARLAHPRGRPGDHRGRHPRPRALTSVSAGAMRGGIVPGDGCPSPRRASVIAGRDADDRPGPGPRGHARRGHPPGRGRRRHRASSRSTPASRASIVRNLLQRGAPGRAAPVHGQRPRRSWPPATATRTASPMGRATPPRSSYVVDSAARARRHHARRSASASATSCSARAVGLETFKLAFGHRGVEFPAIPEIGIDGKTVAFDVEDMIPVF